MCLITACAMFCSVTFYMLSAHLLSLETQFRDKSEIRNDQNSASDWLIYIFYLHRKYECWQFSLQYLSELWKRLYITLPRLNWFVFHLPIVCEDMMDWKPGKLQSHKIENLCFVNELHLTVHKFFVSTSLNIIHCRFTYWTITSLYKWPYDKWPFYFPSFLSMELSKLMIKLFRKLYRKENRVVLSRLQMKLMNCLKRIFSSWTVTKQKNLSSITADKIKKKFIHRYWLTVSQSEK
jgi:hypothetical protein